jgi:hypothetical protein
MLRDKIKGWKGISDWMGRAEERFEKESGWKEKEVRSTLQKFARLNRRNQFLLGGLLVGRAVLGGQSEIAAPIAKKRKTATIDAQPVAVN